MCLCVHVSWMEGWGLCLLTAYLPTLSPCPSLLFCCPLPAWWHHKASWAKACVPRTTGWPHCQLPRHVSFLSCPSAGPPQGPLSTVVLWKVSASHSTLWPDVVIRNSYKKRQNTRRDGGGWGSPGSCSERVIPHSLCRRNQPYAPAITSDLEPHND